MQEHNDIQRLRGITTPEVAIPHSDLIWNCSECCTFPRWRISRCESRRYFVTRQPPRGRRGFAAELRQIQQRRSGLNSPTPGPAAASGLAQSSTPCAPHTKVSETRTVEASNKTRTRYGMLVTGGNGYVGRLGIRRRFASHEAISTQKDNMVTPRRVVRLSVAVRDASEPSPGNCRTRFLE
jgi:hypothetical protein